MTRPASGPAAATTPSSPIRPTLDGDCQLAGHESLDPATPFQIPQRKLEMLKGDPQRPFEMDSPEATALWVSPPRDVEQRENAVKDSAIPPRDRRQRIPGQRSATDAPSPRRRSRRTLPAARGPIAPPGPWTPHRTARHRRSRCVRMVALGEKPIDACDRLDVGRLAELQDFVVIDEGSPVMM